MVKHKQYSIELVNGIDVIMGKVKGELTIEVAKNYLGDIRDLSKFTEIKAILTDLTNAQLRMDSEEIRELSKELSSIAFDKNAKRAVLLPYELKAYSDWQTYNEDEGFDNLRSFFDNRKAVDWLISISQEK